MSKSPAIWWIRRDLRLLDNPALNAAAAAGPVLPLFVVDDRLWQPAGGARRAFLAGCLDALDGDTGGHLVIRHGRPGHEVAKMARDVEAAGVYAAADFGPYGRDRDRAAEHALDEAGLTLAWTGSPYAVEPGTVRKADGEPFKVFTPFARAWQAHGWSAPVGRPARIDWQSGVVGGDRPDAPPVSAALPQAGERAGGQRWEDYRHQLDHYAERRDRPDIDATSRLSPYLKWGCLHPRTLLDGLDGRHKGHVVFRSELAWREFYADVLWHHPASARHSLQPAMASMAVDRGKTADQRFEGWASGSTGYPIVDAGMRQLLAEGWMHNRVRMIVASFLVKDLHIDWTRGARHFMAHLVDGDLASNNHGWQWVAGTGTDAAPYFRVFNPVSQGKRFDPSGDYVRRYVAELATVPDRYIHSPWEMATLPIGAAGYPSPIVDHATERAEALERYHSLR